MALTIGFLKRKNPAENNKKAWEMRKTRQEPKKI